MAEILNSSIVLRLNANFQRLGYSTVAEAFTAMMGGFAGSQPYLALDLHYEVDGEGKPLYDQLKCFYPVSFEDWLKLPIRPWDMTINSPRQRIRVPTVVMCPHYNKMPMKERRPTPSAIRARDDNRCQYTGVPLTNKTFSLDHVVPKSKGGKDSWENLVAAHKDINSRKGNAFNHEVGLKLTKQPRALKPTPLCVLVQENKHPDHLHF